MKSTETQQTGATETVVLDAPQGDVDSVYASLCSKINLKPIREARPLEAFRDNDMLSEASADERIARGMGAFLELVAKTSQPVDRLDKSLLDFHIGQIDRQIGRQLVGAFGFFDVERKGLDRGRGAAWLEEFFQQAR